MGTVSEVLYSVCAAWPTFDLLEGGECVSILDAILTTTVANHVLENNVVTRSHEPGLRLLGKYPGTTRFLHKDLVSSEYMIVNLFGQAAIILCRFYRIESHN